MEIREGIAEVRSFLQNLGGKAKKPEFEINSQEPLTPRQIVEAASLQNLKHLIHDDPEEVDNLFYKLREEPADLFLSLRNSPVMACVSLITKEVIAKYREEKAEDPAELREYKRKYGDGIIRTCEALRTVDTRTLESKATLSDGTDLKGFESKLKEYQNQLISDPAWLPNNYEDDIYFVGPDQLIDCLYPIAQERDAATVGGSRYALKLFGVLFPKAQETYGPFSDSGQRSPRNVSA